MVATDSPVSMAVELATARRTRARDACLRAGWGFAGVLALVSVIATVTDFGAKGARRLLITRNYSMFSPDLDSSTCPAGRGRAGMSGPCALATTGVNPL